MKKLILILIFISTSLFSNVDITIKRIKLIGNVKENVSKRISIEDIEKLGVNEYHVLNPYNKKLTKYTGVHLDKFISSFGANNVETVSFNAIDGYNISISKKEWDMFTILLSTRTNDEYINYDNKGPLRIIYPKYDSTSENFTRNLPKWIWMIKTIEFK